MEEVIALGDLRTGQLLIADRTNVVQFAQLLWRRVVQQVELGDRLPALAEHLPALFRLLEDVEVGVYGDHHRAYRSAALVDQYPGAIAEDEDRENELDRTLRRFNGEHIVVQRLPERRSVCIDHVECIDQQGEVDLMMENSSKWRFNRERESEVR